MAGEYTTVVVANLPARCTPFVFIDLLETRHGILIGEHYDFFYFPTDRTTLTSLGYGFMNFTSIGARRRFELLMDNGPLVVKGQYKILCVSRSRRQGYESNREHYSARVFMDVIPERRPLFARSRAEVPEYVLNFLREERLRRNRDQWTLYVRNMMHDARALQPWDERATEGEGANDRGRGTDVLIAHGHAVTAFVEQRELRPTAATAPAVQHSFPTPSALDMPEDDTTYMDYGPVVEAEVEWQ